MALHYTASAKQIVLFVCSVLAGSWNWNWIGRDWLIAINFQLRKCLKSWVWVLLWIHYILWLKKPEKRRMAKVEFGRLQTMQNYPKRQRDLEKAKDPRQQQHKRVETHTDWIEAENGKWRKLLYCVVVLPWRAGETTQFISPNIVSDSDDRERESPSCRWCYWVHVNCV